MVKDFKLSKCNVLILILDLSKDELTNGMYSKWNMFFSIQNPYFPELILNFILLKAKSKSHIKMSFGKAYILN